MGKKNETLNLVEYLFFFNSSILSLTAFLFSSIFLGIYRFSKENETIPREEITGGAILSVLALAFTVVSFFLFLYSRKEKSKIIDKEFVTSFSNFDIIVTLFFVIILSLLLSLTVFFFIYISNGTITKNERFAFFVVSLVGSVIASVVIFYFFYQVLNFSIKKRELPF